MLVRDVNPASSSNPVITLREKKQKKGRVIISPLSTASAAKITTKPVKKNDRAANIAIIAGAACLILIIINAVYLFNGGLRFKNKLVSDASAGFERIINGAVALSETNFDYAKELFKTAQEAFAVIENETWFLEAKSPMLTLRDPSFDAANALTKAGTMLAAAGALFTDAASNLSSLPKSFFAANRSAGAAEKAKAPAAPTGPSLTEKLKKQMPIISEASGALNSAYSEIEKIPEVFVAKSLRDKFNFAKQALTELNGYLSSLENDMPAILTLLGDEKPHTFLILLQNNAELRPSGGFIGNFAIMETNDGYMTKNEVRDVYSADHQLAETIEPPPEIAPVNKRWFMRDSNYSGHFPASAAASAWFLEKERGPGVDTVIAIDATFISQLLKISGPVRIPELPLPLTADNFSSVLSYAIESKITGRENPKSILSSFMAAFEKNVFTKLDPAEVLMALRAAIESKHIMAYSKDPAVQEFFERRGLAGIMQKPALREDYLNIVHTSIGGNKSDAYISEIISHDTYLKSDGAAIDELSITRTHSWNGETQRALQNLIRSFGLGEIPKNVLEILGRSRNLHRLRIYIPSGAIIENSSDQNIGANVDPDTDMTYFSATMEVPDGQSRTLTIRYRLPFKLNLDPVDKYTFKIQKQAGQENIVLQKRILPDSRISNYKTFPETGSFDADGVWSFETELLKDLALVSVWGK